MNAIVLSDCAGTEAEDVKFGADALTGFSNNAEMGVLVTWGKRRPPATLLVKMIVLFPMKFYNVPSTTKIIHKSQFFLANDV